MKSQPLALIVLIALVTSSGMPVRAQEAKAPEVGNWAAFELAQLAEKREQSGGAYLRFLKVPSLSTGIYHLAKGDTDRQRPHDRDEIYYVTSGRARLAVDGEDVAVQPGSILFVKAGIEHRFHSIEEDLTVLVVFAAGPTE